MAPEGYVYYDYRDYDDEGGKAEFREKANAFSAITNRAMN